MPSAVQIEEVPEVEPVLQHVEPDVQTIEPVAQSEAQPEEPIVQHEPPVEEHLEVQTIEPEAQHEVLVEASSEALAEPPRLIEREPSCERIAIIEVIEEEVLHETEEHPGTPGVDEKDAPLQVRVLETVANIKSRSPKEWGSISCSWRYWSQMIACHVSHYSKIALSRKNKTFFSCCLTLCLHLMDPNLEGF